MSAEAQILNRSELKVLQDVLAGRKVDRSKIVYLEALVRKGMVEPYHVDPGGVLQIGKVTNAGMAFKKGAKL
jgi:hypothetical protein